MTLNCGLDFGTSNSTLGVAANGVPRLLPLEDDKQTIPSAIFFSFEDDQTYFGRKALSEYVTGADGRIMRALKSVLGTSLINDKTRIKRHQVAFTEILGLFIGELKRRAETALDGEIEQVVVGRPVRFVDDDDVADAQAQQQLEAAVRGQGYRHVEFQFEPIAAALDYERTVAHEELALVVDLGGGTSDFTVIRVSPERARSTKRAQDILATAGVHIGGTDFDRLLSMGKIMPMLGYQTETADHKRVLPSAPYYDLATWHRINRLYNPKTLTELRSTRNEAEHPELVERIIDIVDNRLGHRLGATVEEAKIALSDAEAVDFAFAGHDHEFGTRITRADLDAVLENAVSRIRATIDKTLAAAGVPAERIETLILTGGSTLVPAVVTSLATMFPSARQVRTDVLGSVGLGLSLDASRRF